MVEVKTQKDLNPLNAALLEAGKQAGHAPTDDVNGYMREDVSRFEMSIQGGYRSSPTRSYLHMQDKKPNLDMVTGA